MPWLLGSAALWFSGFALLVPVAPLWVIRGGGDALGAGLVTAVMMAFTVLAQLSVRRVLAGLGWRWTLALGSGLLGLPALGHLATDRLWAVTALAALRGLGFGVVTVCGATAVAAFATPGRRGRAIGALGLASAAPQFVLVPVAPWLAERAGFWLVFVLAVLPALAMPLAWPIALRRAAEPDACAGVHRGGGSGSSHGQRRVESQLRRRYRARRVRRRRDRDGGLVSGRVRRPRARRRRRGRLLGSAGAGRTWRPGVAAGFWLGYFCGAGVRGRGASRPSARSFG